MNLLISSSGRRTSLLKAFRDTGEVDLVVTVDPDPLAPTHALSDVAITDVPPVARQGEFLARIKETVRDLGIGLIIPTIDPELLVYARHKQEFGDLGCLVMVSEARFCHIAFSKKRSFRFFSAAGIPTVPTFSRPVKTLKFPMFVKPDKGSGSKGSFKVEGPADLAYALRKLDEPVIQPFMPYPEITIDAFLDLGGQPVFYVPRLRIKTLGGESIQGMTIGSPRLGAWITRTLRIMGEAGARGPITLQGFLAPEEPLLSEVNPRFGGGFPLGLAAGADYPRWCLRLARGQGVEPRLGEYQRGVVMTRAMEEFFSRTDLFKAPERAALSRAQCEKTGVA